MQNLNFNITANVFPNPILDEATLAVNSKLILNNTILVITDIAGRKVYAENTTLKQGLNQIKITKNNLNSGVYFYEILNNSQSLTKGKLMVK
jgi:hypothetical protein